MNNTKPNAAVLLPEVGEQLKRGYGVREVVLDTKPGTGEGSRHQQPGQHLRFRLPGERDARPGHPADRDQCVRLRPHVPDQATQGTPAEYTCCIAGNEEENAWPG
ncbi:hypothetical protein [Plantactinospora sp. DSM 117369]